MKTLHISSITLLLYLLPVFLALLMPGMKSAFELFLLSNTIITVMVLVDWFLAPGRRTLHVSRVYPSGFFLGTPARVELVVVNRSSRMHELTISDDAPSTFESGNLTWKMRLKAGESVTSCYEAIPTRRGTAVFGPVRARMAGPLGLITGEFSFCLSESVEVYPHIARAIHHELSSSRGRLQEKGMKPARVWGSGSEFESLRDYNQDDSYRLINWKATARRQRITVENYEVEKTQNIIIAIDTGRLMLPEMSAPLSFPLAKMDWALQASLFLAATALKKNDRVGMAAFDSQVRGFIPPGRGKAHFRNILEMTKGIKGAMEETDFELFLDLLESRNRKRSLVVVITDFMDRETSADNLKHLSRLYPHHVTLCASISDRALQNEARIVPETMERFYIKTVAGELLRQREEALNILRHSGVDVLDVLPEHLTSSLAGKYMEYKIRGRI